MRDLRLKIGDHALLAVLVNRRFQPGSSASFRVRAIGGHHQGGFDTPTVGQSQFHGCISPLHLLATGTREHNGIFPAGQCRRDCLLQIALFDDRSQLRHSTAIRTEYEAGCAVVAKHQHFVNRRDAIGNQLLPDAMFLQKLPAMRAHRIDALVVTGRWWRRCGFRLDEGHAQSAAGQRAGQAAADQTAADNGDIDFHLLSLHVCQRVDSYRILP